MKDTYAFREIEAKWQTAWDKKGVFQAVEDPGRPKFYCLEMYPYPSGRIHMGHVRNYSIGDVLSRFWRMRGFNVLHPIGWDALGMPAENAAIKHGIHPQKWTLDNIANMKSQLKRLGFSYDWSREVNTCLPEYYRWNQWIFLKMLERGLAFRKKGWVNWCPQCRTVLANEQSAGGGCWRCEAPVEHKEMEHWFLKITAYAQELLDGHQELGKWPEHVIQMQRNWIGPSEGALITFALEGGGPAIEVFTTRVDTIFGATFMLLSPDHPLSRELLVDSPEKESLRADMARRGREARMRKLPGEEEKEGLDTGRKVINPFSGESLPVWIANYVLMDYGTGAVMAVPAHDQRDFEFATKYSLPVRIVIVPEGPAGEPRAAEPQASATAEYGVLVDSGPFSGLKSAEAMDKMSALAQTRGFGRKSLTYRLRDWGISRQRYWGTPIPVIFCDRCGIVGVPYEDLPVELPHDVEFTGEEGSPLEKVPSFVEAACPKCGGPARRETDTMDTFFDSSWYFLRYASPHKDDGPFDPAAAAYWMPVDLYIGGVEHAILHLIYARFFTRVLRDLGYSPVSEPFPHYLAQGMVTKDGSAMSKSKGNVVDPDDMLAGYGADALRLFILFASPPEKEFAWNEDGIEGCSKFLNRVWTLVHENLDLFEATGSPGAAPTAAPAGAGPGLLKKTHQSIRKVTEDIGKRFHLNTAVSALMELYNLAKKDKDALRASSEGRTALKLALETMIVLLSPFTPHICEEMWEATGHRGFLARQAWPAFDPELAREEKVTVVVQVNGKLKDRFEADAGTAEDEIKSTALGLERVSAAVAGKTVRKVICIGNKLVNIVVS